MCYSSTGHWCALSILIPLCPGLKWYIIWFVLNLLHVWMILVIRSLHQMISEEVLYLSYSFAKFSFCIFVLTKEWVSLKWDFIIFVSAFHSLSSIHSAHFTVFSQMGQSKCNFPPSKAAVSHEGLQPILTLSFQFFSVHLLYSSLSLCVCSLLCIIFQVTSIKLLNFPLLVGQLVYKRLLWCHIWSSTMVFYTSHIRSMTGGKMISLHS